MLLWSKRPWSVVDPAGSEALPSGRLVAGITQTDLGPLTVVGVCIPWRDAHVRTGRKDRDPWQDHESWLSGFETLPYRRATERTVVLGDFNQRIPGRSQPKRVYEALLRAFDGLTVATTDESSGALAGALLEPPANDVLAGRRTAHARGNAPAASVRLHPRFLILVRDEVHRIGALIPVALYDHPNAAVVADCQLVVVAHRQVGSAGLRVHSHVGQNTETSRLLIVPGGTLITTRLISPADTFVNTSHSSSRCQFQLSGLSGSTCCQASRTNAWRCRRASSFSIGPVQASRCREMDTEIARRASVAHASTARTAPAAR